MDLSASAVTVSIPGTSRSRALTSRTQCRHRHATDPQSYRRHPGLNFVCVLRPSVRSSAVRRLSAGGREGRRSHRMCPHVHQEPRGDCRATRGRYVATEAGQAEDRRPVEPFGIGSITAPLNIEREGPMSSTAPAAERIAHCRRAIRGDHGHVHHRQCLRGAVRHHGVSSRAPLTESCRTLATSQPSGEEPCPKSLVSHRRPQQKEYLESVSGHSVALAR